MITKRIKQFITKNYNSVPDCYCWYNTEQKLTNEEIRDLKSYFDNKKFNFMLIINGCSQLRPQRTWLTFPTFLKGIDGCHIIYKSQSNSFILCSWLDNYEEYEDDKKELLSGLNDELEIIIFEKNTKGCENNV